MSTSKNMDRCYTYSLVLIVVMLLSCTKSTQQSISASGSPLIKLQECYNQTNGSETIILCFDSVIEDSRCPKNVQCIWSGVARIKLTLSSKTFLHSFTLASLNAPPRYVNDTILEGYKIKFVNLHPHPGDTPSEVKAEVKITR